MDAKHTLSHLKVSLGTFHRCFTRTYPSFGVAPGGLEASVAWERFSQSHVRRAVSRCVTVLLDHVCLIITSRTTVYNMPQYNPPPLFIPYLTVAPCDRLQTSSRGTYGSAGKSWRSDCATGCTSRTTPETSIGCCSARGSLWGRRCSEATTTIFVVVAAF